jgi:signal transduction histidine kinase
VSFVVIVFPVRGRRNRHLVRPDELDDLGLVIEPEVLVGQYLARIEIGRQSRILEKWAPQIIVRFAFGHEETSQSW